MSFNKALCQTLYILYGLKTPKWSFIMLQGMPAEAASRQEYDNWKESRVRDWNQAQDGIDPDRATRGEDWIQVSQTYVKPTSRMDHTFKNQNIMNA